VVDGIKIHFPLYHSKQHGHRLFNPYDTNRATFPRSYVFEHANWPRLVETFHRMRTLSQKHDFPVTVVLVPSAARIYGRYFEGFPKLSDAPHFLNEVAQLASDTGFGVFDLVSPLQRRAETELLYFRDDHHWNLQGNRLVAEILAKHLYPAEAEMNPPKMQ
jgi:hypothetical protein